MEHEPKYKNTIRRLRMWIKGTLNIRVYKCEKCKLEGKNPVLVYTPNKKRLCPKCGGPVKRSYNEKGRI